MPESRVMRISYLRKEIPLISCGVKKDKACFTQKLSVLELNVATREGRENESFFTKEKKQPHLLNTSFASSHLLIVLVIWWNSLKR
jgi:hypothetical protein